jgi:protein tyrosine/serine phosphatase
LFPIKRKSLAVPATLVVCGLLAGGAHAAHIYATNNFATVVAGEVYRSAQPNPELLAEYRRRYHIRTVINLRGSNGEAWYKAERRASEALGIKHIDFRMASNSVLSLDQANQLIEILKAAPKPILIHCKAGADRTGLASALYLAAVAGVGEDQAEAQLSIRYGHFSVPYLSAAYPMDDSFERMESTLGF